MIKRPLPIIGCAYLLSLAVVFCLNLPSNINLLLAVAVPVVVCIICFIGKFSLNALRVVLLSVVFFSFGLLHTTYQTIERPTEVSAVYNQKAQITAVVLDFDGQRGSKYDYEIKTTSIALYNEQTERYDNSSVPQSIKMRLTVTAPLDAQYYDTVNAEVSLVPPYPIVSTEPYVVRSADSIYAFAYCYGEVAYQSPAHYPLMAHLRNLRDSLKNAIEKAVGGDAGKVASAIITGQKREVPTSILYNFRVAGISHMLAVSGLHTAILIQFLLILLSRFKLPKKVCSIICMVAVVLFMALTGFTPSVVRAGIMACTLFLGQMFHRKSDAKNSIALAGLIICIQNPAALLNIGFLLSFSATISILVLMPALNSLVKRSIPWLWNNAAWAVQAVTLSLSATVFTYPIIAVAFQRVSLVGPITNMLITPLIPIMLIASLFAGIFGMTVPYGLVTRLVGFVAKTTALIVMHIAEKFAALDYASARVNVLNVCVAVSAAILCAIAVRFFKRKRAHTAALAGVMALILCTGVGFELLKTQVNNIYVAIPSSTLTQSAVIHRGDAAIVLAGADSKKSAGGVLSYMNSNGISEVETLFVPYLNEASNAVAKNVLENTQVTQSVISNDSIRYNELIAASAMNAPISEGRITEVPCLTDCSAQILKQENGSAVLMAFHDITFLFIYGNVDAARLPQSFKQPFVCVISGSCPTNFDSISAQYYSASESCITKSRQNFLGKSLITMQADDALLLCCGSDGNLRLESGSVDIYR